MILAEADTYIAQNQAMVVFLLAINHDFSVNVLVYKMWKELILILVLICVFMTKKRH